jgi:serine/threonine protein kinase/Tfp pilus assembly protein PilF
MDETLTIFEGDPHYGKYALKVWGPFQLLENVGQGGFGEVYRAFDTVLEREVALKLLLPRVSSQESQEREILREARLLAKVRHPNVVSVYGVDTHEGRVGFWSDFVRGRTLTSVLSMQGPFGPREAALVGIDLCKALAAVHAAGLLHRDIKTSNAMREEGGRILLMDFGLSLDENDHHGLGGTPAYMAPELFGGGQASVASDIYALGVLLYHLLTAKYPVDAPTLPEFAALHQTNQRRSLYEERTDVPDQLVGVIETATRRNPAVRFQSAGQMLSALSESLGTGSSQVALQSSSPRRKRTYWWLAIPSVVFLGAVVWFTPARHMIPFLPSGTVASGAGAHASYQKAQEYLDKYYQPHNLDKAIAGFRQTVALDPQFALAYGGLCRAYYIEYRNNQTPELLNDAQSACTKALDLDRGLASVHVTSGMLYTLMTDKNSLAQQELDAALALDKRNPEVYGALGELYAKEGRSDDVEPAYQTAQDLAPGDWRWPKQLGDFFRDNGRFEDAVKQYRIAVGLTPDNSRVWNNLGIAYRRQSKFQDAQEAFQRAIQLDPASSYLLNLGAVLEQVGKYPEAVSLYLQASQMDPSDYLTLGNLASAYDRIPGDRDKAHENYLKAIALAEEERKKQPNDATLLSALGSYYATIGVADKGLPLLRQAVALEPDNPQVLYRAAEGHELLHDRDEALRLIGKALERKYSLEALKRNPEMAALIADRRFAAIAAKNQ